MAYDTEGLAKLQHLKQLAELLKGEFATEEDMRETQNEMQSRYEALTASVNMRITELEMMIDEIWSALN